MGTLGNLWHQLGFEVRGSLVESLLRFPVIGDVFSMTGDVGQMNSRAYPLFVEGFSAPARYQLERAGIEVLGYNNNGVIWVSREDAEEAEILLREY